MFTDAERNIITKLLESNIIDAFMDFNNGEGLYRY